MALNIRRVGEVADGSVTATKLANGAVDLNTNIVTGSLPSIKLADSAVVESKLADLAISTQKLQNNVVTLAKADNDIKATTYVGDESIIFVSGNIETDIKEFSFSKKSGRFSANLIRVLATIQTNNSLYTGSLSVYINDETSSRAVMNTNSTSSELVSSEFSVSDLNEKKHTVKFTLMSDNASGVVINDYVDILLVK